MCGLITQAESDRHNQEMQICGKRSLPISRQRPSCNEQFVRLRRSRRPPGTGGGPLRGSCGSLVGRQRAFSPRRGFHSNRAVVINPTVTDCLVDYAEPRKAIRHGPDQQESSYVVRFRRSRITTSRRPTSMTTHQLALTIRLLREVVSESVDEVPESSPEAAGSWVAVPVASGSLVSGESVSSVVSTVWPGVVTANSEKPGVGLS